MKVIHLNGKRNPNNISIDRKDSYSGYNLNNIVISCMLCNLVKSKLFSYEEGLLLGKTVRRIRNDRKKNEHTD